MTSRQKVIEVLKTADAGYNNISVEKDGRSMELRDFVNELEGEMATVRELKMRGKSRTAQKSQLADKIKRNKFYVGAESALERNWGHPTLAKAVAHAEELMEEQDQEQVFVVQIIRVVRRRRMPAEVVKV